MKTQLLPCNVPWVISPSSSGVTLFHSESDEQPDCTVVFGGGRLQESGKIDLRRIELIFEVCRFARAAPKPDNAELESCGFDLSRLPNFGDDVSLQGFKSAWLRDGYCPESGFYVASESRWLSTLPDYYRSRCYHFVVCGRDGYVELIAQGYTWREWRWENGHREESIRGPVIGLGDFRGGTAPS